MPNLEAIQRHMPRYGTYAGHGHVWECPDGVKARCAGPGGCNQCAKDNREAARAMTTAMEDGSLRCVKHPESPVRDIIDGDPLCQECCDDWVRGEGAAAREAMLHGS